MVEKATIEHMNWDMVGHEWAVDLLREHVVQERGRHAYLLTGPQGVGRRTLALRLAQALNCQQPLAPGEPCLMCRTCRQIGNLLHPDLAVVQAETIGGNLKVDQVREVQRSLSLAPYEARFRVALLLRFEEANDSAANALLKTLEEPPPLVKLVLTAESSERLLPTIVSRCEVLRLRPLPFESLNQALQQRWGLAPEEAQLLAHVSGGRPGYALRLHEQPELLHLRQSWLDDLVELLGQTRVQRFTYAESLAKDKDKMRSVLQVWMTYWRDLLLHASGVPAPMANLDRSREIAELAQRFGVHDAHCVLTALDRTLDSLDHNANTRLACEVLMLDLPNIF